MELGVISSGHELLPYDYFDPNSTVQTFFLHDIKKPPTLASLCIHKIHTHYSVSPTRSVLGRILASLYLPPVILSLICDHNNILITYFINYEDLIVPCDHDPMLAIELHASWCYLWKYYRLSTHVSSLSYFLTSRVGVGVIQDLVRISVGFEESSSPNVNLSPSFTPHPRPRPSCIFEVLSTSHPSFFYLMLWNKWQWEIHICWWGFLKPKRNPHKVSNFSNSALFM